MFLNKNVMICLEKLDIGGVETYVLNQSMALQEKGYNVTVLAEEGIYTKPLKDAKINVINTSFRYKDKIDLGKVYEIVEIIKNFEIEQVHIHQLLCAPEVVLACSIASIPYIMYVHTSLTDAYDWFSNTNELYNKFLKDFYNNAHKIIALSDLAVENHSKYFNLNKDKYVVLHNSIDFKKFNIDKEVQSIKKFAMIYRFSPEKIVSIKNGIDLFSEYYKKDNTISLELWGDGPSKKEIEDYIKEKNIEKIAVFRGRTGNIKEDLKTCDVIIGIGRCILEAIALKKIAIISGNEEIKFLVEPKNIEEAYKMGFASKELHTESNQNIISTIENLNSHEIKNITKNNLKICKKNLNIAKNIYILKNIRKKYGLEILLKFLKMQEKNIENLNKKINKVEEEKEKIWEGKQWLEKQCKYKDERIAWLEEQTKNSI